MAFLFLPIALVAEIVGTIAGFGSSTIALPLSLLLFDFPTALVLVAFLHISGNIGRIAFFRHGLAMGILLRFGAPSVLATLGGALLVGRTSQDLLKMILGLFLVGYAVLSWSGRPGMRPSTTTAVAGGALSGFLAGLIGTGGALRGAFLNAFGLPKERYVATAAAIALAVDITRLPVYLQQGLLPAGLYAMVPLIFAVAVLGSFVGKQVVRRISQPVFRRVVRAAIALVGLTLVYDWLV